ncbi:hypothetical protein L6164_021083 [Bauhinia variegata]|uniref:Uncharacterized protein n=1 Tax=Bauhinia variegata TaxID=167791 RepID=A0ACB9MYJ0_BAUVA|nr:hypothetical protein L6164_021083 [Bauhinia variegata]
MADEQSLSCVTFDSECAFGAEEKKSTADSAKQAVPEKDMLPLRLFTPHGQRLHKQMCIEYGVTDRLCETCGETGQLTCFLPGFRKWALRRVTSEELSRKCNRCGEVGHNCLECDIPITYKWANDSKRKHDLDLSIEREHGRDGQGSPKGH